MENRVPGNSSKNWLVVILEHPVHLRELIFSEHVLESKVQMKLQALLGSGGKSCLLGGTVVWEFNTLVDTWEMDQRIEKADPVEASFKDLILIDILS